MGQVELLLGENMYNCEACSKAFAEAGRVKEEALRAARVLKVPPPTPKGEQLSKIVQRKSRTESFYCLSRFVASIIESLNTVKNVLYDIKTRDGLPFTIPWTLPPPGVACHEDTRDG